MFPPTSLSFRSPPYDIAGHTPRKLRNSAQKKREKKGTNNNSSIDASKADRDRTCDAGVSEKMGGGGRRMDYVRTDVRVGGRSFMTDRQIDRAVDRSTD